MSVRCAPVAGRCAQRVNQANDGSLVTLGQRCHALESLPEPLGLRVGGTQLGLAGLGRLESQ